MTDIVNELAHNLELIEYQENNAYEKDIEIIKAGNEMNEAIENMEIDAEAVIEKIMNLASIKFDKCTVGNN